MPRLSDPIQIGPLAVRNRVFQPPMCMYSARHDHEVGVPTDFHVGHYGQRAAGGTGLVIVEATGVVPEGRISPYCLGLWNDAQEAAHARIAAQIENAGACAGIQLGHAGRKASVDGAWRGGAVIAPGQNTAQGAEGWEVVAPSALAFPGLNTPRALNPEEIGEVVRAFASAAKRAEAAGYEFVQIHGAHGYLLHQFLSPVSNERTDSYGGSFENRIRLVLEVIDAVKAAVSERVAVGLRISSTDWVEENPEDERDSWTVEQSIELVQAATRHGVDTVDVSSAGLIPAPIPADRDYQVSKAIAIKKATGATISGVGRISEAEWASELVSSGDLDAVSVGSAALHDASWANHAFVRLGETPFVVPQYERGRWS